MKRTFASLVSLAFLACGASAAPAPHNFGIVVKDGIYRGAHPKDANFEFLRELGVRTILKLNSHGLDIEEAAAREVGIRVVNIPFEPDQIGSASTCGDVARALKVLNDRSNWPVYVHCTNGRDRTGYLVGLYRMTAQHWSWDKVDQELSEYGHGDRMKKAFPLISSELSAGAPSCADALRPNGRSAASP